MDYSTWYKKVAKPFSRPRARQALALIDKGSVALLAAGYLVSLTWLAWHGDMRLWKALLVPAAAFALTTILRRALNRPRPYEACSIDPLIPKQTHGLSLPSRHVACAAILALELQWLCPPAGAVAWLLCAGLVFTRVVGGVHFPWDVAWALALALALGIPGFFIY